MKQVKTESSAIRSRKIQANKLERQIDGLASRLKMPQLDPEQEQLLLSQIEQLKIDRRILLKSNRRDKQALAHREMLDRVVPISQLEATE